MKTVYNYTEGDAPGIWMVRKYFLDDDGAPLPEIAGFGDWLFTFDKKKIFNFWPDYPNKLTKDQVEIFKKAFPEMARLRG